MLLVANVGREKGKVEGWKVEKSVKGKKGGQEKSGIRNAEFGMGGEGILTTSLKLPCVLCASFASSR